MQNRHESSVGFVLQSEGDQLISQQIPILLATFPGKHEAHDVKATISIRDCLRNMQRKRQVQCIKCERRLSFAFTKAWYVTA